MSQTPIADYIMSLPTGNELTSLIEESVKKYVDVDYGCSPHKTEWSRDKADAVLLWDIIEEHVGTAGIIRVSDAPSVISQMCSIGEESELTTVYTGNWIESLCKAYLLHEYGFYGDYLHPEFKRKMDKAPIRKFH